MRLLLIAAGVLCLHGSAWASEKHLTFSMLDMDVELRKGTAHLVDVALDGDGRLQMHNRSLIPMANGGYAGVVRQVLRDGSITAVFHLQQRGADYSGDYAILSGSGAYAGAHGQGSLETLSGHDAAASNAGIYQVRLHVMVP